MHLFFFLSLLPSFFFSSFSNSSFSSWHNISKSTPPTAILAIVKYLHSPTYLLLCRHVQTPLQGLETDQEEEVAGLLTFLAVIMKMMIFMRITFSFCWILWNLSKSARPMQMSTWRKGLVAGGKETQEPRMKGGNEPRRIQSQGGKEESGAKKVPRQAWLGDRSVDLLASNLNSLGVSLLAGSVSTQLRLGQGEQLHK